MTNTAARLDSLLGTNEVLIAPSVVEVSEQAALIEWVEDECSRGRLINNPVDPHTHVTPFMSAHGELTSLAGRPRGSGKDENRLVWVPEVQHVDPLPSDFWRVRARVSDLLSLSGIPEDPYKGSFLTYMDRGGQVQVHRDERVVVDGEEHLILRCNVLFSKPYEGGYPIIAGKELNIPERGMWAFYATELVHSSAEVSGSRARGTLSFGFLIKPKQVWQRCFRLAPARAPRSDQDVLAEPDRLGVSARIVRGLASSADGRGLTVEQLAETAEVAPWIALVELHRLQALGVAESLSSRLARTFTLVI